MQEAAGIAIAGKKDVMLLSPTGSGKTLAFLLPLARLLSPTVKGVQCLVLVPSRELALQIESVWKSLSTGFKVNSSYGGHLLETEVNNLSDPPALLIGTPGRISDHINRASFATGNITTLILDEFDKSLALGFEEEMSFIIGHLKNLRKRVLVSATANIEIPAFTGVQDVQILDFITTDAAEPALNTFKVISEDKDKVDTLFHLLCHIGPEATLIFCNHREAAERTGKLLSEKGIDNAVFHGGLEQREREQTLATFRNGSVHYLVATDLAARGLDIPTVRHIVHYHMPGTNDEYIHRNGRTARMNATGNAYLLLHKEEPVPAYITADIEELQLPESATLPAHPQWVTLYISGGKKDKLNKTDIVGFLSKIGHLGKDELGMIEVKDHLSYAAVKKGKIKELLYKVQNEKMKGKKYKIAIAK